MPHDKTKMKTDEEAAKSGMEEVDEDIEEIELPKIDVRPFVGKKVKIVSAKVVGLNNPKFPTRDGLPARMLRVETETVTTVGKTEIKGSRIFGLQRSEEGTLGWGAQTKLGQYLASMKAKTPQELVGKTVILQLQPSTKGGAEFLTFV
jgi:hypothetical protein